MTAAATWRALPGGARWLLMASAVNNLGSGLVLPLLVAWVTTGLGLDVRWATTAVALTSVAAAITGPLAGVLTDTWGAARTLLLGATAAALGTTVYGLASTPAFLVVAATLLGVGIGANAAWFTALARSVAAHQRAATFGLHLIGVNVGLGTGAIIGSLVAASGGTGPFRALYLLNAATFVIAGIVAARVVGRRHSPTPAGGTKPAHPPPAAPAAGGVPWRTPGLLAVLGTAVAAYLLGYSQLEVAVPAVLLEHGRTTVVVGVAFAANTLAVVLGQFVLLNHLSTRDLRAAVGWFAGAWLVAWLVLGVATADLPVWSVAALGCLSLVVFGLGECVYGVTLPTLVNAVAAEHARGRVNGLYSLATSIGFALGPLGAGAVLAGPGSRALVLVLAAGCAVLVLAGPLAITTAARAARVEREHRPDPVDA